MRKVLSLSLLTICISLVVSACSISSGGVPTTDIPIAGSAVPTATASAQPSSPTPILEFMAEADDVNALQATQRRATVELKQYDFGAMVVAVNGQAANQEKYWALYINDQYAVAGPSQTLLKPGDKVKWVLEKIEQGL